MADIVDIDSALEGAFSAYEARDPDRAQQLCRDILDVDPDHPEALNLLGVMLQDRGQAKESIALISRAIEIDPTFPDAHANLARGYRFVGAEGEAVTAARRATELDPDLGEGWLQLGLALVTLGHHDQALAALREAISHMPEVADLHASLGAAAQALSDHQTAANAWRDVLRLQPDRNDARIKLGIALGELNQLDEAMVLHRRAVEQAPGDVTALAALATTLHRRFDGVGLVSVCRQILAIDPGRLDILAMLSNGQIWLGQFEDIDATRAAVLAVEPRNHSFAQQLGAMIPRGMDDSELTLCRTQLHDLNLPISERVNAGYALAKALDQTSDHDAAFEAFRTTNTLVHAADIAAERRFNPEDLKGFVDNTLGRYTPALFAALTPLGNSSELPVFIVGMPRSGTSLVEQIAASHPRVFGAGELKGVMELVTRLNRDRGFVLPTQWDMDQLRLEISNHLDHLRALGGGADRVIDKLPDNIQMLGHIRILFPNARIIICRRDPRDVCLSCYTTRFGDHIAWSNDLEDCAKRAVEIERLTRHWLSVLPGPVLEIRYEEMVANLEAESRQLIDFLGLDWDPACLEFHKTQRPVTTSSAWQVRQPLYDSSVGRWRRYQAHLGPMLKILAPYLPDETTGSAARDSGHIESPGQSDLAGLPKNPPPIVSPNAENSASPTSITARPGHSP